jgi:putative protease
MTIPELVCPAGDWNCARAAVENGADAIYFGLERHNARMRAANFTMAELPRLMEFLHLRGVRGYVTFNTLVFDEEMAQAEECLRSLISAGADAAIVQDVGICRLIRQISPDFPMHASTQMTVTSAAGIEFARQLGCRLVILARECSVRDIKLIHQEFENNPGAGSGLPLEIFIHGALCVAYSGQCLTSEALGGRSANRGVCAQACRMPYQLIADGRVVDLGDRRYLLSPRDLAGLEMLPDLVRAGVASLKIEGRLKTPEYVASITGIYRHALDRIAAEAQALSGGKAGADPGHREESGSSLDAAVGALKPETRYEMEMAFSRGLHTGWLGGTNHQELVHGRFGKKRGVFLGEVVRVAGNAAYIRLQSPLKAGDGVGFDAGRPEEDEEGGRLYAVVSEGEVTRLEFGSGDVDFRRVRAGNKVWKTSDPELDRRLRQTFSGEKPRFRRAVAMKLFGRPDKVMVLEVRDSSGATVRVDSSMPLARAETQPLGIDRLRGQLGRLGGTPFRLGDLQCCLEGDVMLPLRELNRMRRQAVEQLCALRTRPPKWTLLDSDSCRQRIPDPAPPEDKTGNVELIVLVRSMKQLEAACNAGIRTIYCDFEDPKRYREAVSVFRRQTAAGGDLRTGAAGNSGANAAIWVAPPRIFRPGEEWVLRLVRSCEADGFLVRNHDHLKYFYGCRTVGDYTLNIANSLSAEYFKSRFGLERMTASYDLNVAELRALLRFAPASWFEITVHQHMPMFHMEHCLFCAFLSQGTDYADCGRPCDTREIRLRDRTGAEHGVKADAGCRNTVFSALAQTGAESLDRWIDMGVRHFRIEFLDESPELVARTIASYRRLLRREIAGAQLWRELKLLSQIGVTRGSLD